MNGTEIVTIYYVSCIHCKHELEINRKPAWRECGNEVWHRMDCGHRLPRL